MSFSQILKTVKAHGAEFLLRQEVSVERNEEEELQSTCLNCLCRSSYLVIFAQASSG